MLLRRGDLPVLAFWPDKAILSRLASKSRRGSLPGTMLRIRTRMLTSVAVPLQPLPQGGQDPGEPPLTVPELD